MHQVILALLIFLSVWLVPGKASAFDHSLFDQILRDYVDGEGLVDYNAISKDSRFSRYMTSLQTARPGELSREGRLAFWINSYNAVIIDKVIKKKPKKSVLETAIPGAWISTKIFRSRENTVANREISPDDIEHKILRKEFNDPRIHFAIICASRGCPPMPREAYTEENVDGRLEEETKKYLNSARGMRMDREENRLYLSKVFDWFGEDFIRKSGSIEEFIRPYVSSETRLFLDRKPGISYLKYDWSLNAKERLER